MDEYTKSGKRKHSYLKYGYLRRYQTYRIPEVVSALFQQHHFGFGRLTSFRTYIRKHATNVNSVKMAGLGINGMLANQLYRSTLVPSVREAYVLVRSGGVSINEKYTKNPRKPLYLGDEIKINSRFRKSIMGYYLI